VFERTLGTPRMNPEGKNALIDLAELSRAGEHATAVYEDRQSERFGVLASQDFGCELGAAIKRQWGRYGEMFCNTSITEAGNFCRARREPIAFGFHRDLCQRVDRIYAA